MAQLIVRNLDQELVRRLKMRAVLHGCSAEAEHRAILEAALRPRRRKRSLKALLRAMPDVGEDRDFARAPDRAREIDF